ncbi:radical SAM family heme chaperone HemW [Desulfovibrio sp. OttesenSCG-928-G15]|nr:radical SAM family heme chaperone HemW [Desulfovibrio sp. OttesenSCG-928-G15]
MRLYVHVPFCRVKCVYCAFYSIPLSGKEEAPALMKAYIAGVIKEIRLWGERLGPCGVESIFFGGGTPSLLPASALEAILAQIKKTFRVQPGAEISAEANPDSALAEGWLFSAKDAGINRLSLGVQSFDDADLIRLGRPHDARIAEIAFTTARTAGFTNISLDFMWGLPGTRGRAQSQKKWQDGLRRAFELRPEHISAYGLTLEPDSPLKGLVDKKELSLPTERELSSMYLSGADLLEASGYMQYEISNFARMGFECRHNIGYWRGDEYLGFGPAATSTLADRRWTNPANLTEWAQQVEEQRVATNAEVLDAPTRLKECIMLRLRMSRGLSLADYQRLSGRPFQSDFANLLPLLQKNGLGSVRNGYFRLSRNGMLVSDTILAHFFETLDSL